MGVQRLRNAGFHAMPKAVAVATLVGGVGVVGFGGLLLVVERTTRVSQIPRVTLEPMSEPRNREGNGVLGRVVTSEGRGVEGAAITLLPLFEAKGIEALETTSDADGSFRFADVKVDPGSPYVAEVTYDGARFASEVLRAPRTRATPVTLVVARSTRKAAALVVRAESLAVVGDERGMQAVHALTVENEGTRAFTGALDLPLLRGAAAIQEGPGLDRRRLELTDDGMTSRAPVLPGRHDVTYTYVTQMSKDGIALSRDVTLPTDRYELLVAGDLDFEPGRGLREDGDVSLGPEGGERTYTRFVATDLEAGDEVGGRIGAARPDNRLRIVGPVAAVILALVILAIGLLRRKRVPVAPAPQAANVT